MLNSDNSYTISCSRNAQVTFVENPQRKIICFENYKHWYLFYTWSDKAFKGYTGGDYAYSPFNKMFNKNIKEGSYISWSSDE